MKSIIPFRTPTHNTYFLNRKSNLFHFSHPLLNYIFQLENRKINIDEWYANLNGKLHLEGYGSFAKNEISYYFKKYKFIKTSHNIDENSPNNSKKEALNPLHIKSFIANCDNISFEVTQKCNLNCKYCTYSNNFDWFDNRSDQNLKYTKAILLLDYIFKQSETHLNNSCDKNIQLSFYGGEPLLNFDFIEKVVDFVSKMKLKKTKVEYGMTTNAILLKKYSNFLVKNNFQLMLSLDGNEKHNSYRVFHNGKPAYKTIMDNILYLKNKHPEYFKQRVNFNAVLTNRSSVTEIYSFFKEHFETTPDIMEISMDGIKPEKVEVLLNTYKSFNESISELKDSFLKKTILSSSPQYNSLFSFVNHTDFIYPNYNSLIYGKRKNDVLTGTCLPFTRKIFVTAQGKILPCENIDHKYALGSISENNLTLNLEEISNKYADYEKRVKKMCYSCYLLNVCEQCVFYMDIHNDSPKCDDYKNKQEDYARILANGIHKIEKNPSSYYNVMQ